MLPHTHASFAVQSFPAPDKTSPMLRLGGARELSAARAVAAEDLPEAPAEAAGRAAAAPVSVALWTLPVLDAELDEAALLPEDGGRLSPPLNIVFTLYIDVIFRTGRGRWGIAKVAGESERAQLAQVARRREFWARRSRTESRQGHAVRRIAARCP